MSPSLYVGIDMVTLWGPIWWTSKIVSFYLWLSTHPNNTVIVSRMSFATTLWTVPKGYSVDFNHFPSGTVGIQDLIWLVKTCACRQLFGIIWKNIKMYMNLLVIYNKHVWFANLLSITCSVCILFLHFHWQNFVQTSFWLNGKSKTF